MNVITRVELADWLEGIAQEKQLIAPRDVEGVLLYRPIEHSTDIVWDFIRPVMSIKDVFFPATERLLTIEKIGQEIELTETLPEGEAVIFGVRPCDARGVKVLDALFLETEPVDPYYARRRANTTLVGLACKELGPTCFCTSVGGSPSDANDVDLMLTEMVGGYVVQAITDKGRQIADRRWLMADGASLANSSSATGDPLSATHVPTLDAWPAHFNDEYWEAMAERCLGCRICAYVCPTCRCFDIRDEAIPSGNGHNAYERIRCWDSCAGAVYRRIAGGHNPRPEKGQRLRNRFFCKFDYYPEQYGPSACTGCGRCIDACPVNIDITEVLQHLAEVSA
jgi:sulfhydrogenase subunit beta (sulfur reductase)